MMLFPRAWIVESKVAMRFVSGAHAYKSHWLGNVVSPFIINLENDAVRVVYLYPFESFVGFEIYFQ